MSRARLLALSVLLVFVTLDLVLGIRLLPNVRSLVAPRATTAPASAPPKTATTPTSNGTQATPVPKASPPPAGTVGQYWECATPDSRAVAYSGGVPSPFCTQVTNGAETDRTPDDGTFAPFYLPGCPGTSWSGGWIVNIIIPNGDPNTPLDHEERTDLLWNPAPASC